MSTHTKVAQVSARVGALIVQSAASRGVDVRRLMIESGFNPDWLNDPEARMGLVVEERLWERAAELSGDPLFGLHAAQAIRPGAFDVLDYVVRTAPDLLTALHRLARYNRLVHDLAAFEINPQGETVRIEHRFDGGGARPCRQAAEFTLASLVVVGSQMAGQPVHALAVEFTHPAPDNGLHTHESYRTVFGVTPRFDAPASFIVLPVAVLERPVPAADPTLSRIVTTHAEHLLQAHAPVHKSIAEQVRCMLAEHLSNGPVSLTQAAQRLHMSERSLQRRLDDEGTRFADLADEVRRELALRYISDPRLSLGEVAFLLGFAEPSPFHRAFRRWTGMTPAMARRRCT